MPVSFCYTVVEYIFWGTMISPRVLRSLDKNYASMQHRASSLLSISVEIWDEIVENYSFLSWKSNVTSRLTLPVSSTFVILISGGE
jgi:hypothetical protein